MGPLEEQLATSETREKEWIRAATKEFLLIVNHPRFYGYKRMDQVLFHLVYLLARQNREDLARPIFQRLLKDYPRSQYIPDAYLSFGDYFFAQKDIENALTSYDKVVQLPSSRVHEYARYKEAWCYFRLQDFKKALEAFVDVITTTKAANGETGKIHLITEAKRDAVKAYAQLGTNGTPDKAWPLFKRIGGDYATTMLEMLAQQYQAMGKAEQAAKIRKKLAKMR